VSTQYQRINVRDVTSVAILLPVAYCLLPVFTP